MATYDFHCVRCGSNGTGEPKGLVGGQCCYSEFDQCGMPTMVDHVFVSYPEGIETWNIVHEGNTYGYWHSESAARFALVQKQTTAKLLAVAGAPAYA